MHWIAWVVLPIPLFSLISFGYAWTRKDAEPKHRRQMLAFAAAAAALGILLLLLVIWRT